MNYEISILQIVNEKIFLKSKTEAQSASASWRMADVSGLKKIFSFAICDLIS